jgi:hypothetical protein
MKGFRIRESVYGTSTLAAMLELVVCVILPRILLQKVTKVATDPFLIPLEILRRTLY